MFPTHVGMNRQKTRGRPMALCVFPTHVGMNHAPQMARDVLVRVPHARGDEPEKRMGLADEGQVFPTHVGMNRHSVSFFGARRSVPHARGDEPAMRTFTPAAK